MEWLEDDVDEGGKQVFWATLDKLESKNPECLAPIILNKMHTMCRDDSITLDLINTCRIAQYNMQYHFLKQERTMETIDMHYQDSTDKAMLYQSLVVGGRLEMRKSKLLEMIEVIPKCFCCPITHMPYVHPVGASDGHTYEEEALRKWIAMKRTNPTSPITGKPMRTDYVPNYALLDAMKTFESIFVSAKKVRRDDI